jgi:CBS-domain-containing membrane protein
MSGIDESSARTETSQDHSAALRYCDDKFRTHWVRYLSQSLMAAVSVLVVLLILDSVKHTVLIASLGASAFIAFGIPRSQYSRPRYLIGGYLIGMLVGATSFLLASWLAKMAMLDMHEAQIIFGALATGLAMLLMVITDTEHPPAASLALGFVLNEWDALTVLAVISGIVALASIKEVLKFRLIDLL